MAGVGKNAATVKKLVFRGSPTECALLKFVNSLGFDYDELRKEHKHNYVSEQQFDSEKKMMSSVYRVEGSDKLRVYVKGAAESVLKMCVWRVTSDGNLIKMDRLDTSEIERDVVTLMGSNGLRTLCLAFKDVDPSEDFDEEDPYLEDLVCLGIAAIRDPVRDEVPAAVDSCQKAGICVRMITGDNLDAAKYVAEFCGIYKPGGLAMLGRDFYELVGGVVCAKCNVEVCGCVDRDDVLGNPEAFLKIVDKLQVLARSQPNDKYALVTGLKKVGRVVAVTGDGTNDAPALKKADVGFAMNISGKEVAKQAADIVLLDDNFKSIVLAVMWGRNIYDNIRRFLQFQITVNIVAVSTAFITAVVLRDSPLKAVQLLWLNLIMDSLGSLALATEPPSMKLLERMPHERDDYLISKSMWRNILGHALYQFTVLMVVVFPGHLWIPEDSNAVELITGRLRDTQIISLKCVLQKVYGST
eukprot:GHVR01110542.1.p1 GENE.GHVR01110542.1~~GHVR01110542.1.p1  ORF type:complete len:486 (+),score=118.71 GHVR01110542.1:49-1458(+)